MKAPNWPQYTGVRAPVAASSAPASEPDWERYTGVAAAERRSVLPVTDGLPERTAATGGSVARKAHVSTLAEVDGLRWWVAEDGSQHDWCTFPACDPSIPLGSKIIVQGGRVRFEPAAPALALSGDLYGPATEPTVAGLTADRIFTPVDLGPDFWRTVTPEMLERVFPDPIERLKAVWRAYDERLIRHYRLRLYTANDRKTGAIGNVEVEPLPAGMMFREDEEFDPSSHTETELPSGD